jgi:hypothetical protein
MLIHLAALFGCGDPDDLVTISLSNSSHLTTTANGVTCYAWIQYNTDAKEYRNGNPASSALDTVRNAAWITDGTPGDFWVERTIDSGTLEVDDIGGSRVQMNSNLRLGVTLTTQGAGGGVKAATVTVKVYDDPVGGDLRDEVTFTLQCTEQPA